MRSISCKTRGIPTHICRCIQVLKENAVKPVLNEISRVQNIFPLKPGFRLIKVYYDSQRDLKIFPFKTKFRLIKSPFKTGFTVFHLAVSL
jgi:hypothetical protein